MNYKDLIDRYHNNEFEASEWSELLNNNAELKKEYDAYLNDMKLIKGGVKIYLKKEAERIYNRNKRKRTYWLLGTLLAVLLLSWISVIFLEDSPEQDSEILYAQLYEKPIVSNLRSPEGLDSTWINSTSLYKNAQYEQALEGIDLIIESNSIHAYEAKFLKGICFMELKDFTNAIASFNKVEKSSLYYFKAQWFMSLSYYMSGDINSLEKTLNDIIATENHPYLVDAKKLQKAI